MTLNSEPTDDNHALTKSYVDCLSENDRNRQDMSLVINDRDYEFDYNKLINLDILTVNQNPTSDNELSNRKNVDYELNKNTFHRLFQTLQNFFKVIVGNIVYKLTKKDRK